MSSAFEHDGSLLIRGGAATLLPALIDLASSVPTGQAGVRLYDRPMLSRLLGSDEVLTSIARNRLGEQVRPVRAILFDKSPSVNWTLGWHQDRTISVAERYETAGFGPWTIKHGLLHVEPPFAVIETMLTLRVHLDPIDADNAPLLVAPGSHHLGRIAETDYAGVIERCGTASCLAETGDVWVYATPILHASMASRGKGRRRVLQIDFAAASLPGKLRWDGIERASMGNVA